MKKVSCIPLLWDLFFLYISSWYCLDCWGLVIVAKDKVILGINKPLERGWESMRTDYTFNWGMDIIPPYPFWDFCREPESVHSLSAGSGHETPAQSPKPIPPFPWCDRCPKAAPHARQLLFAGFFRADRCSSMLSCIPQVFSCSLALFTCIMHLYKKTSWKVRSWLVWLDSCLTFGTWVHCGKWVY